MFCLGCGAETPARATRCPVCGRELRGVTGEVQWTVSPTASASSLPVPPVVAGPASARGALNHAPARVAGPSIGVGDLDAVGLPRDTYGRALLIAAAAMVVDLLAPWVDVSDQPSIAPAQAGLPMLIVVVVLALAVVPVVRPSFRARPVLAVMPVVVGGMFLGLSLVAWGLITSASLQRSQQPQWTAPDGTLIPQGPPMVSPGFGLYLFILGSAVLIVTGYHVFLEAARRSAPVAGLPAAPMAVPPPAVLAEAGVSPSSGAATPAPTVPPPVAATAPDGHAAEEHASGNGKRSNAPRVALPGSASWNEEPKVPVYTRPSPLAGGWSRQPRPRR